MTTECLTSAFHPRVPFSRRLAFDPFRTFNGDACQSYVGSGKLRLQDRRIELASATHIRSLSLSARFLSIRRMR